MQRSNHPVVSEWQSLFRGQGHEGRLPGDTSPAWWRPPACGEILSCGRSTLHFQKEVQHCHHQHAIFCDVWPKNLCIFVWLVFAFGKLAGKLTKIVFKSLKSGVENHKFSSSHDAIVFFFTTESTLRPRPRRMPNLTSGNQCSGLRHSFMSSIFVACQSQMNCPLWPKSTFCMRVVLFMDAMSKI